MKKFHFNPIVTALTVLFGATALFATDVYNPVPTATQSYESYATNLMAATQSKAPFSVKRNLARKSASLYYYTGQVGYVQSCPEGRSVGQEGVQVAVAPLCSPNSCAPLIYDAYTDAGGYFSIELDRDDIPSTTSFVSNWLVILGSSYGTVSINGDDEDRDWGLYTNCDFD